MVCLEFELVAAGWKTQMKPLSYGGCEPFLVASCLLELKSQSKSTVLCRESLQA